jgi:hypothetical protein
MLAHTVQARGNRRFGCGISERRFNNERAGVDIGVRRSGCSACALLERRRVASCAPPQQNITNSIS